MAAGIRRTLSLQGGAATCPSPSRSLGAEKKAFHARSTSLPTRSHPALARFDDNIHSLRSLPPRPDQPDSDGATWLADGLGRIDRVHASLADILRLPQSRDSAIMATAWADRLLDDSLLLADTYSSLRSIAADLKQHLAEARAAIRRGDSARLSSALRSQRRAEKELSCLTAAVKSVRRPSSQNISFENMAEVEVAGTVGEAIVATTSASVAIFEGMATMSSAASAATASTTKESCGTWSLKRLTSKKKGRVEGEAAELAAMEKMGGLEEWIEILDQGSEEVFRSLVNTRVSLLNALTPSL